MQGNPIPTPDQIGAQPLDADLAAIAALSTTGAIERTGDGTAATFTVTANAKQLLDDSTFAAMRTTLELGDLALQSANNVDITGGSISNITDLAIADGGTGASTPAGARTNLELGSAAVLNVTQGTWTPAYFMTGGGSVTVDPATNGVWRRMGNWVEFWGYIVSSGVSSPVGSVQISLPFTAKTGSLFYPVSLGFAARWQTDMPNLRAYLATVSSTTRFLLAKNATNAIPNFVAAADLSTGNPGNQLVFSGKYEVA